MFWSINKKYIFNYALMLFRSAKSDISKNIVKTKFWCYNVSIYFLSFILQVLLIGHVPPGYSTPRALLFMFSDFNKKLVEIILNHTDVISAMYFGHEHRDTFKLFYNSSGI